MTAQQVGETGRQDPPGNMLELGRRFSSEEACSRYMLYVRWPDGFVCPHCGGVKYYWIRNRGVIKCARCRKQISLTAGTVMEKSKTSLCKWFVGAYLMITHTPGISAAQFQLQAAIPSYECAFQILHKLRTAATTPPGGRLRGEVELDEAMVGGSKTARSLVAAVVEVEAGEASRVSLRKIRRADCKTLTRFLLDHVEPGSVVSTRHGSACRGMWKRGYRHRRLAPGSEGASPRLAHVRRILGNLQAWLGSTHHGVSAKHIQAYLNEYAFRFNSRKNAVQGFNALLRLAAARRGPTYEGLYTSGKRGA